MQTDIRGDVISIDINFIYPLQQQRCQVKDMETSSVCPRIHPHAGDIDD